MAITWIVGHILAVAIGISLGLLGGGGSILAVPIFVYLIGLEVKEAIAMSLAVVGIVSLIGVIPHWFQGNINFKIATIFTPTAMIGVYLGADLASLPWINEKFQLLCFGMVMLIASLLMIRKGNQQFSTQVPPDSLQKQNYLSRWLIIPFQALGVGILTGFVGVGGGFVIIPALVLFGGIAMKEAIGTSLLIITFNSATGFISYLHQVSIDGNLMLSFALAASLGSISGAYLTNFLEAKQLQKGFGYFVLFVATFVLIKR